jgi:D-alanyl-D-alanine carboxypeptidase (penicillin-binding protein 5/6)
VDDDRRPSAVDRTFIRHRVKFHLENPWAGPSGFTRFLRFLPILWVSAAWHTTAQAQPQPGPLEEENEKAAPTEAVQPGGMPNQFRLLQPGEIPLSAEGAVVIDGFTGQTLYEKNADQAFYPASTTKIMTALLVIEAGDLDREVSITEEDARVGESSLSLKAGERYTRRQMLFGLMLKSANDVAHALGRDNAGTMAAFALKMTHRAGELGAIHTSFKNPHGLHHLEHFTTPRDLAVITRHAMQQPYFRRVVSTTRYPWQRWVIPKASTPSAKITASSKSAKAKAAASPTPAVAPTPPPMPVPEIWHLSNHNRLLTRFDGCTGVKTGYTNPAQHTLVSAALRGGREVIATVMKDRKLEKWEDSMLLLTYGLDNPPKEGRVAAGR